MNRNLILGPCILDHAHFKTRPRPLTLLVPGFHPFLPEHPEVVFNTHFKCRNNINTLYRHTHAHTHTSGPSSHSQHPQQRVTPTIKPGEFQLKCPQSEGETCQRVTVGAHLPGGHRRNASAPMGAALRFSMPAWNVEWALRGQSRLCNL